MAAVAVLNATTTLLRAKLGEASTTASTVLLNYLLKTASTASFPYPKVTRLSTGTGYTTIAVPASSGDTWVVPSITISNNDNITHIYTVEYYDGTDYVLLSSPITLLAGKSQTIAVGGSGSGGSISNLTDIATRNHNDLQNIQGGASADYYHMTQAQHDDLTDGGETTLHTHARNAASGNIIKNANLEIWEYGIAAAPGFYTVAGSGATIAKETTIVKQGLASAKLTRVGNDCTFTQDIYIPAGSTFVRSRQYTFGAWVYATVASRVRLVIDDGVTATYSSYHTGGSAWEWLTVTLTVDGAATQLKVGMSVGSGNTSGYIDGLAITEGSSLNAGYYPNIVPINELPQRTTMYHRAAKITTGNTLTTVKDSDQWQNELSYQDTPANADSFTNGCYLRAGTYTFKVLGFTGANEGYIDWYVDGVSIVTNQDWYSASPVRNVVKTVNSVVVSGDGWHHVRGTVNGKNGSSGGYYKELTEYWFEPAAD